MGSVLEDLKGPEVGGGGRGRCGEEFCLLARQSGQVLIGVSRRAQEVVREEREGEEPEACNGTGVA